MRYTLRFIIPILLFTLSACVDKVPNNGPLDDMWQLMTIEEGGNTTDTKERQVYWSVRANIVQFNGYNKPRYFSHFLRNGNNLLIFDFCFASKQEKEDDNDEWMTVADIDTLKPWGIRPEPDPDREGRLRQLFYIEYLDYNRMILTSGSQRLTFRKF